MTVKGRMHKINQQDVMSAEVADAIQMELDIQKRIVKQIFSNLFFDTCSIDQLEIYEGECGILPSASQREIDRRAAVEARWKTSAKCDLAMLQAIADSWQYGKTELEYTDQSLIVTFVDKGIPVDVAGLMAALEEAKPAHIPIEYIYRYNTHNDLAVYTHGELSASTHEELQVR